MDYIIKKMEEKVNTKTTLIVEVEKDLLVELYNFAYKQAVTTNTVDELKDIDRRFNGPNL